MKRRLIGATVGILAMFGATAPVLAQEAEIAKLADQWTAAYNLHDSERLGALYTDDAHLYVHGSPRVEGRADITDFWSGDMTEGVPLTVLTVTDSVEGTDMILVHGNYQVLDRETGVAAGVGRFAHIWLLLDDDTWKLDRDLWQEW